MRTWTERDAADAIRGLDVAPVPGAASETYSAAEKVAGCCGLAGSPPEPAPAAAPASNAKMVNLSSVDCSGYWWYRFVPTGTQLAVGGFVVGLGYRLWKKATT